MSKMNLPNFANRVRGLYNIDFGVVPEVPASQWPSFRDDPVRFFICCDDPTRDALWRELQRRAEKYDRDDE